MFTNAFVQTYFSIHYAAIINGNTLTYDVTNGVDYNITYETPENFYQCTGQAIKFNIFDPHFIATRTEKTINQLRISGLDHRIEHGANCSQQQTVTQSVNKTGKHLKVKELSANFMASKNEFYTIELNSNMVNLK